MRTCPPSQLTLPCCHSTTTSTVGERHPSAPCYYSDPCHICTITFPIFASPCPIGTICTLCADRSPPTARFNIHCTSSMEAMVDEVEEEDEVEEDTGIKDNMEQRMVRSYPY